MYTFGNGEFVLCVCIRMYAGLYTEILSGGQIWGTDKKRGGWKLM